GEPGRLARAAPPAGRGAPLLPSGLPALVAKAAADRGHLVEEPPTVGVLQVEDRVKRPVEVVGELGRLRNQSLRRRLRHSPRCLSSISARSTSNDSEQAGHVTEPTASPSVFSRS